MTYDEIKAAFVASGLGEVKEKAYSPEGREPYMYLTLTADDVPHERVPILALEFARVAVQSEGAMFLDVYPRGTASISLSVDRPLTRDEIELARVAA